MPHYRISEAARLLSVSDDTVRRWIDQGHLAVGRDEVGRQVINGADLAARAVDVARAPDDGGGHSSARNRLAGIVTAVEVDGLMAQVDLQCGPFALTSLMSRDAAKELSLQVGSRAIAVVNAPGMLIETPWQRERP